MRITALVLAAGASLRAGGPNKLLAPDRFGRSMIARSVRVALQSRADDVVVVLGHDADVITERLRMAGLGDCGGRLRRVLAQDHAEGMAASLRCGVARAILCRAEGALVCLGDMPLTRPETLDRLIGNLARDPGALACVPVLEGVAGNPVLWRATLFDALAGLSGDRGGKMVLERHASDVRRVAVDDPGILEDFDTPERLAAFALC